MADTAFCQTARDGSAEPKNVATVAVDFTADSGCGVWRDFICVFENGDVAVARHRRRTAGYFCGCGRDAAAGGVHIVSCGSVDNSSRGNDWLETEIVSGGAADRAGGGVCSGDGAISDYFAAADSRGGRVGGWFNSFAAAWNAVVSAVQCDRGRDRNSYRLERSLQCVSFSTERPLAWIISAGNFSFLDHRICDGVRRSLEREHHRGIFPFPGNDLYDDRLGRGDQQCNRHWKFPGVAGGHDRDGRDGGDHQPAGGG